MTHRSYCFTLNNPEKYLSDGCTVDNIFIDAEKKRIKFAIWQLEKGEEGTVHCQGYLTLESPSREAFIRQWLFGKAHWTVARGSHSQNVEYCGKDATRLQGPFQIGEAPSPGKRNDLIAVKSMLDEGAGRKQIADEYFGSWVRYHKSFELYRGLSVDRRDWKTQVIIFWGVTGGGKTHLAKLLTSNGFWWSPGSSWWDGYSGQDDIVMDEFRGGLPYSVLLRIMDNSPLSLEVKGSTTEFVARRLFITSNIDPRLWYDQSKFDFAALERRIDMEVEFVPLNTRILVKGPCTEELWVDYNKTKVTVVDTMGKELKPALLEDLSDTQEPVYQDINNNNCGIDELINEKLWGGDELIYSSASSDDFFEESQ